MFNNLDNMEENEYVVKIKPKGQELISIDIRGNIILSIQTSIYIIHL